MGFRFGFDEEGEVESSVVERAYVDLDSVHTRTSQVHNLKDLLQTLHNVRISYEPLPNNETLYRRQLHDVHHQLMMEDDLSRNNAEEFDILMGSDTDLKSGVYEGGLKSWECAYDCILYLSKLVDSETLISQGSFNFVEIGCGTSLPSLFILQKLLLNEYRNVKMVLTDYNYQVLRLITVPNLLLTWYLTTRGHNAQNNELLVTQELIDSFITHLEAQQINISFISGGWSRMWMNMLQTLVPLDDKLIMVTSETIYSPETYPILAQIVRELHQSGATSIVAAKDFYFGVGGSVEDFLSLLNDVPLKHRDRVAGAVWRSILNF